MTESVLKTDTRLGSQAARKTRIGFVGLGWIGKSRMEAIANNEMIDIAALADLDDAVLEDCSSLAPECICCRDIESVLQQDLDAIVIATPTGLHKSHALAALERNCAVFCQKPLATTAGDVREIVDAAQSHDCLLGVDLSYRHIDGIQQIKQRVETGEIGDIYAVDLVFHNAYGPDKSWFYDYEFAGGGCVIDLGIHLVDLAMWILDWPDLESVESRIYKSGKMLRVPVREVEDYASASLCTANGTSVNLACSWNLSAGCDAVIKAHFYGTKGALTFENIDGSFFDFAAYKCMGTKRHLISEPPDAWYGRAALVWAQKLQQDNRYDSQIEQMITVAEILDKIYER